MAEITSENQLQGRHICILSRRQLKFDARLARAAQSLAGAGAKVSLVVVSAEEPEERHYRSDAGYEVYLIPRRPPKLIRRGSDGKIRPGLFGALWRYLRGAGSLYRMGLRSWQLDADVYQASDLQPLPVGWLVSLTRKKPLIYEAREISSDREAFQRFSRLVFLVERFFARRAVGFFTTTRSRAEHFTEHYKLREVGVVQNRPPYSAAVDTGVLRRRLGLDECVVICLYQGGLQQGRGLKEVLHAAVEVPEAHFVFLGAGALEEDLKRTADDLGVSERTHFLAPVPFSELPEWTASADIGLQLIQNTCLNHYTTDSNKLFEYAMAGLPVIASDFPEIRAVLDEWGFGKLIDPADHDAVVASLRELITNSARRKELAARAKQAAKHLDWKSQVPDLLAVYEKALVRYASGQMAIQRL